MLNSATNLSKSEWRVRFFSTARNTSWVFRSWVIDSDIPVTETQTDTEMIDISKTHTETKTEKIFNTDTIYI